MCSDECPKTFDSYLSLCQKWVNDSNFSIVTEKEIFITNVLKISRKSDCYWFSVKLTNVQHCHIAFTQTLGSHKLSRVSHEKQWGPTLHVSKVLKEPINHKNPFFSSIINQWQFIEIQYSKCFNRNFCFLPKAPYSAHHFSYVLNRIILWKRSCSLASLWKFKHFC